MLASLPVDPASGPSPPDELAALPLLLPLPDELAPLGPPLPDALPLLPDALPPLLDAPAELSPPPSDCEPLLEQPGTKRKTKAMEVRPLTIRAGGVRMISMVGIERNDIQGGFWLPASAVGPNVEALARIVAANIHSYWKSGRLRRVPSLRAAPLFSQHGVQPSGPAAGT